MPLIPNCTPHAKTTALSEATYMQSCSPNSSGRAQQLKHQYIKLILSNLCAEQPALSRWQDVQLQLYAFCMEVFLALAVRT